MHGVSAASPPPPGSSFSAGASFLPGGSNDVELLGALSAGDAAGGSAPLGLAFQPDDWSKPGLVHSLLAEHKRGAESLQESLRVAERKIMTELGTMQKELDAMQNEVGVNMKHALHMCAHMCANEFHDSMYVFL